MTYYSMKEYKFLRFQRSGTKGKKYDAILENKKTGIMVIVPFGDKKYQHYKDTTGLGLYKKLDHKDENRRRLYSLRHSVFLKDGMFSPGYFSFWFLWG